MFILDTNVVSELRKVHGQIDRNVEDWADSVGPELNYLASISVYELDLGVRQMERRDPVQGARLRKWVDESVVAAFQGRIFPFDTEAALQCAALHIPDPRPLRDAMIAAVAIVRGMTVVTRNVRDFAPMGVKILNPWESAAGA